MKAVLTNLGTVPVPLTSSQGDGLAVSLQPGVPHTLDDEQITVATIGDNPSFAEDLTQALGDIAALAVKLITFWRANKPTPQGAGDEKPIIRVRIVADASNSIRVTGDDKTKDAEVVPGSTHNAEAFNYVELRQLGV